MKLLLLTCLGILSFSEKVTGLRATCPTESVKAEEGGDATFQCRLVPSLDLVDHTIDWQREDVGDVVHVYRHKRDDPDSQAERYRGRTTVDREDLRRGLLTLLISPVRLSDGGRYSCFVPALHTRCSINLIVEKPGRRDKMKSTKGPPLEDEPELDLPDGGNSGAAVVIPTAATAGLCLLLSSCLQS